VAHSQSAVEHGTTHVSERGDWCGQAERSGAVQRADGVAEPSNPHGHESATQSPKPLTPSDLASKVRILCPASLRRCGLHAALTTLLGSRAPPPRHVRSWPPLIVVVCAIHGAECLLSRFEPLAQDGGEGSTGLALELFARRHVLELHLAGPDTIER